MSEVNPTAEELVRNVTFTLQRANVIPTPVDPTLSNEGEAADAKATGDAIAGIVGSLRVNTKAPVNNAITIYAGDILVSDAQGAQTVAEALIQSASMDASEIIYDSDNLVSVKAAIDGIKDEIDTELTESEIDAIFDDVFGGDD